MLKANSIKSIFRIFLYGLVFISFLSFAFMVKIAAGQIIKIIVLFFIVVVIVHFITLLFSKKLRKDLDVFLSFFRKASVSREKINKDILFTTEFKQLADSANSMLDQWQEKESCFRQGEEWLADTFHSITEGVITCDTGQKIVLINRSAEKLIGCSREEVLSGPLEEVFQMIDEQTGEVLHPLKSGNAVTPLLIARDGTRRLISFNTALIRDKEGNSTGSVLVFRDITGKKQLEDERQKTHQLKALGLLANGIAHDFNNLLTGISGSISQAKNAVPPGEKAHNLLIEAEKAGNRAKGLTRQLLTFAVGGTPIKKVQAVADLIEESVAYVLQGVDLNYQFTADENLWVIEADKDQVIRMFSNLIVNAVQAMPEGGDIHISATNVGSGENTGLPLDDRRYVRIAIRDTGAGIPPELQEKIFDPFFTTKSGVSGLGLTSARSIIEKHDGYIHVESQPDRGSIFFVYIPASYEERPQTEPVKSVTGQYKQVEEVIMEGEEGGRILIMDDDHFVGDVAVKMLSFLGYRPEVALDGRETIDLYKKSLELKQPYDVVIMDLTIPGGMGGAETIKKLLEIDPHVKAIVSSGYSHDPVMADFRRYGFRSVIMKPYKLLDLKENLELVLGE